MRKRFYKWLYQTGKYGRDVYVLITFARQAFYTFTGRKEIAQNMITEHMDW